MTGSRSVPSEPRRGLGKLAHTQLLKMHRKGQSYQCLFTTGLSSKDLSPTRFQSLFEACCRRGGRLLSSGNRKGGPGEYDVLLITLPGLPGFPCQVISGITAAQCT